MSVLHIPLLKIQILKGMNILDNQANDEVDLIIYEIK